MSYKECLKTAKKAPYLHTIKHVVKTMYLHDTAYREFVNVLMHEIAAEMCKYYGKLPGKKTGHLFYTTDIYEVNYYFLEKQLRQNIEVMLNVQDSKAMVEATLKKNLQKNVGGKK
jgi:hypothetical protein